MTSGPRVSVVIRALDEARHLPRLLHSLSHQSLEPAEIILVDSGSTDGSVEIALDWGVKVVHIQREEFTFGRSLNIGCSAATGDYLLIASAHVYPQSSDWIQRLVEPLEADPQMALTYGGQDGDHTSNYGERRLLRSWFPAVSNLDQRDPFCNNANCMVRSELWRRWPYDEALPGLEDIAWADTVLREGFRIGYIGDARIVHLHDEGLSSIVNRYRREAIACKSIFGTGGLGAVTAAQWFAQTLAIDIREARDEPRPIRSGAQTVKFRVAQYVGAVQSSRSSGESSEAEKIVDRMFRPATSAVSSLSDSSETK